MQLGQIESAIEEFDKAIALAPGYPAPYRWKAAALANLGRLDEARAMLAEESRLAPGATVSDTRNRSRYVDTPGTRLYFDGLRMAGMPE